MDEAWNLERTFWEETSRGGVTSFYRQHLVVDGFVVLPSGVVNRNDLILKWDEHKPLRSYELSEPTFTLLEGGNVVITYHVAVDAEWIQDYKAYMTVLYTWAGGRWGLVFRSHTPCGDFPF